MGALCLEIERIKEAPCDFLLEAESAWWLHAREALGEPEVTLRRPVRIALQAYRLGRRLFLRGEVRGEVELVCGCCLEPYGHEIREPLQLLLEPAPLHAGLEEGTLEFDPEDPEFARYAGQSIELEPVVLELLALGWPVQPRCNESCLGLCPVCGSNRNRDACSCDESVPARPFAALAQLLRDPRERG